ncbi:MAG: glycosyltransferase family 4 protein [Chloroflexota bacterium]|nr:glycosyltransferase family 4 protein [Chloroflexota bacterium]
MPASVCMHVLGPARSDVRVMREATTLRAAGYDVSIVDVESAPDGSVEEEVQGVWLKHIMMPSAFLSTRFKRRALLRGAQILLRATYLLLRTPADIYHAHDVSGLLPCYIVASLRQKPLVFDAHELPLSDMNIRPRWLLALLGFLVARIVPRCTEVITVSPPIALAMTTRYCVPAVSVIRNVPVYKDVPGSDRLRQHLNLPAGTRIALYQGVLQPDRSLDKLVHAAPHLDPGIVIVLMGPGKKALVSDLQALIVSQGVNDRVKILPPVDYDMLLTWTASADIGLIVYASNTSLNVRWCMPNKLFEYLMAGLPILSAPLDAIAEVIKTYRTGRIVPSLAPTDIAASINAMLADPAALAVMRRNALYVAKHEFRWEQEAKRLVQLYRRIEGKEDAVDACVRGQYLHT